MNRKTFLRRLAAGVAACALLEIEPLLEPVETVPVGAYTGVSLPEYPATPWPKDPNAYLEELVRRDEEFLADLPDPGPLDGEKRVFNVDTRYPG